MKSDELLAALKERAAQVEAVMKEDLEGVESPLLKEIIHHAIFQGGKRIRPLLCLLAAELTATCGTLRPLAPMGKDRLPRRGNQQPGVERGTGKATEQAATGCHSLRQAGRLAIAFEYLHTASLLHDDVIDHALLRRGAETANKIWGMEPVILAGDYLHARAMTLAGTAGGPEIMALIGEATAAMVESEFIQMANARELLSDEAGYFKVLAGKTAALIAAACETGAALAQGNPEQRRALRVYGANLGLAFQIVDDLLDYLGDPAKTGKAVGNDFQEGKMTLPLLKALARAGSEDREVLLALLRSRPEDRRESFARGLGLIGKYQGFVLAREKAEELIRQALAGLEIFAPSPARALLTGLAGYVLSREK